MINRLKPRILGISILFIIIIILTGGAIFKFKFKLDNKLKETTHTYLSEFTEHNIINLKTKLSGQFDMLESIANFIGNLNNINDEMVIDLMDSSVNRSSLTSMTVSRLDGKSYSNDGIISNIQDRDYFKKAKNGERNISEPLKSSIDKKEIIVLSAPIYKSGKIVGVLSGIYDSTKLNELLGLSAFDEKADVFVAKKNGDIIAQSTNSKMISCIFKLFNKDNCNEVDCIKTIKENMKNDKSGYSNYNLDNEKFMLNYRPLGINDWYVFSVVPNEIVSIQSENISYDVYIFALEILLVILIFIVYIAYIINNNTRVIINEKEKFKALTDNILGGVKNCLKDEYMTMSYVSQGFLELTGYSDEDLNRIFKNKFKDMIYKEDIDKFNRTILNQLEKQDKIEVEYRIVKKDGSIIWILERSKSIKDNKGNECIQGVLTDITELKKTQEELNSKRFEIEAINNNIVGGIVITEINDDFDSIYLNEGYLNMIGYTRKQLKDELNNKLIKLIFKDDRRGLIDSINEQLKISDTFASEQRIEKRDGTIIWILLKGRKIVYEDGKSVLCSVIVDITSAKLLEQQLKKSEERHEIIIKQTQNIIVEWDIEKDQMNISPNWYNKFGYDPITENATKNLIKSVDIYQDDMDKFISLIKLTSEGSEYEECEIRLRIRDTTYAWFSIKATTLFDDNGMPYKVVGSLTDIDEVKREAEKLKERAEKDPLTDLYNKKASQSLIEEYITLDKKRKGALMIIDIDDFKGINDNLGHLYGDAVLSEIASDLINLFRASDIVGRIGGDEFIVFMKDVSEIRDIINKAEELVKAFERSFVGAGNNYKISLSVGIARFPQDGLDYMQLFRRADIALYSAKGKGKNCYTLYDKRIDKAQYITNTRNTYENVNIDRTFKEHITNYIFDILYESNDIEMAVNLILDIVGRHFNVSRVYIFENSDDNLACKNTFEWCNEGISSEIDNLKNIYYDDLGNYLLNFNADGLFYCNDIDSLGSDEKKILKPQDIRSILQCKILEGDEFRGFVGFDECSYNRMWTSDEVNTLTFISKTLSMFLLKMRIQNKLEESLKIQKSVMDNMDIWAYVVDRNTYELLFINKKMLESAPNTHIGDLCYKAILNNQNKPCKKCPMRHLKDSSDTCKSFMRNKKFDINANITTTTLKWFDGKDACLIFGNEVSSFEPEENV
ncbi:diguanylate cyclase domain-containing protein [Clostridioides sp. GD02404]|uniref:sensor domain-containing diguanylate cyclase n=1 Tax=Clostridioides sp. GD02404 TaxID=3054354 RepID=UPI0038A14370